MAHDTAPQATGFGGGFAFVLVIFILLVIIGASITGYSFY